VCVHYRSIRTESPARDPLPLALAELAACAPRLDAVIAIDSALATGRMNRSEVTVLRSLMLPSRRGLLELVDGGCQSGTETIVRMLLRSRRLRHRTQVWIDGVGRVDILVGDRLIIEIDGAGFHTGVEFERDRCRDFELVMRGYQVLRLSYDMVMTEWDAVQRGLLDLIDRGQHLWGFRAGRYQRDLTHSIARKHLDPEQ
jgi:very-short-patch-repair endonuclease